MGAKKHAHRRARARTGRRAAGALLGAVLGTLAGRATRPLAARTVTRLGVRSPRMLHLVEVVAPFLLALLVARLLDRRRATEPPGPVKMHPHSHDTPSSADHIRCQALAGEPR